MTEIPGKVLIPLDTRSNSTVETPEQDVEFAQS